MTTYLQNWVDSSKDLPAELLRCFKLMQELDRRSLNLQHAVESSTAEGPQVARQTLSNAKDGRTGGGVGVDSTSALTEQTEANIAEVLRIADEKVNLAHQIYDFVDRNICRLDKELRGFDAELNQERGRLGLLDGPAVAQPEAKRRKRGATMEKQAAQEAGIGATAVMAEIDPNEPTYCYCNRVSFGEMIGCDNPDCAIEWFHFECVGIPLDGRPKGKWYCRDCTALKKAGKIS